MWKVMIADDEPNIRCGLRYLLEREGLDLQIVGEAENGLTALQIIKDTQPDILLLDICMPFLNGLNIIKQIHGMLTECKIIIITGHDEFEYAQQALKLKVFDYILKPVSQKLLYEVVNKAKAELAQQHSTNKYMNWATAQLNKNIPYLRERCLNDFINNRLTYAELEEQMEFYGVHFAQYCGMLVAKVEEKIHIGEQKKEWDRYLLLYAIQNIIEELLDDWQPNVVFKDEKNNIVAILSIQSVPGWVELGLKIESAVKKYLKQTLYVIQAKVKEGVMEIPYIYEKLTAELKEKGKNSPVILRAKKYIEENYFKEDLSRQDVAEEVGISPSYLSRMLKEEEGYSFTEYLTLVRIKNAIKLMDDPMIKLYDIASRVGYNTQHYFSAAFKKVLGVSPIEFRNGGK